MVDADNSELIARSFVEQERRARDEPTLPSSISLELATNPFLRCATPSVARSAQRHAAANLLELTPSNAVDVINAANATQVFSVLRQWKNEFRG